MERIGVFHDEFAPAHQSEARTDLIAKLGLYLVEVDWQLLVAVQLIARQVGDDLFVSRANAEFAVMTVFQTQQLRAVLLPTAGFLPEFSRLYPRHQHFQRAGLVHFFANDGLGLA